MTLARLLAYTPNGASQGPIPAPQGLQVSFPVNDIGACTWTYPTVAPRAAVIGQPIEVAVEVSADQGATWSEPPNGRFLYLRDGRDPVKDDAYQIECPGYALRLRKGLVFNLSLDTDGKRHFTDASPGQILNTLMSEAQARGALTAITWAFTAANDSGGVAWPAGTLQNIAYDPGTDILTIVQAMADSGLVDYRFQGRELQVYPADGAMATDRTIGANPVSLRFGRDLVEAPFRRTWEALADVALVMGDNLAASVRTNGGALTPWGRQETFVTASGVTDSGTLAVLGDGALSYTETERVERTYGLSFDTAKFLPFRDYAPGEWVYGATDPDVAPTRMRVRQVTLTMDDAGVAGGNAVLNDRFVEADILQARRLDKIIQGATQSGTGGTPSGAGNDILQPAQVAGLGATALAYLADDGRALSQITLDWADTVTNADGSAATDIDHYEVWRKRAAEATYVMVGQTQVSSWTDSPYEPNEEWDFQVRAVDQVFNRGAFSAAVSVTTAADMDPPPAPSAPTLSSTTKAIIQANWDGLTATAGAMPADFAYVEVHASAVNDFAPVPGASATLVGTMRKAGSVTFTKATGTTQHVKLLAIDTSANAGPASAQATVVVSQGTDGNAPALPVPWNVVLEPFAVGALQASWPAVANADRVTYDVYVAAGAAVAVFDATTYVGSTQATSFGIRSLADGSALTSTGAYYVAVKARDDDGTAPGSGAAGPANIRQAGTDLISSDYAYLGKVQANQISAGTLSADLALAARIYTAATGRRITLSADGLTATDDVGNIVFSIPTDLGLNTSINTDVVAQSITALGAVALRSTLNEIAKGAVLILRAGTSAPVSPPTVAIDWAQVRTAVDNVFASWNFGTTYNASQALAIQAGTVSGTSFIIERDGTTGAIATNRNLAPPNIGPSPGHYVAVGAVRIGADYWTLGYYWELYKNNNPNQNRWYLARWTVSGGVYAWQEHYEVLATQGTVAGRTAALGYNGTYLMVAYPDATNANKITVLYWDIATHAAHHVRATDTVYAGDLASVNEGVFDLAASRTLVTTRDRSGGDVVYAFNNTPNPYTRDTAAEFAVAYNDTVAGMYWDSSASVFRHQSRADNILYTYDGTTWAGASPQTWKVTNTWYDNDATGGVHESAQGPAATIAMKRRARLTVTTPNIPSNDDPADHDDANAVRIYVGNGSGAYNTQYRQASPATGVRTASIVQAVFSNADTLHPNPPQFGDFPNATPGRIVSDDGTKYIDGFGDAHLADVVVDTLQVTQIGAEQIATTGGTYSPSGPASNLTPAGVADLVFTAPPSGRCLLLMGVYMLSKTAGQATTLTPEVRAGNVLRAGTIVHAFDTNNDGIANYNATYVKGWCTVYLDGLTPGASYNAYPVVVCGAAGATWTLGKVKIIPQ